jgi:GAF domain-containing protein
MRINPGTLAKSIGELADLDPDRGFEDGLRQVLNTAKLLFDADATGIMLLAEDGLLRWVSVSDGRSQAIEDAQEHFAQGPCQQAFARGAPATVTDLQLSPGNDQIGAAMAAAGIRSALSVPVMVHRGPVGSLDVYAARPRAWDQGEVAAATAYAGVVASLLGAALGAVVQGQLAAQLQVALVTRVVIEQAKGVLMATEGLDAPTAWIRLRDRARSSNRRAVEIAREVIQTIPSNSRPAGGA